MAGEWTRRFADSEPPTPSSVGEGVLSPVGGRGAGCWEDGRCSVDPRQTPGSVGSPASPAARPSQPARWQKPPFPGITESSGSGREVGEGRGGRARDPLGPSFPSGLGGAHAWLVSETRT